MTDQFSDAIENLVVDYIQESHMLKLKLNALQRISTISPLFKEDMTQLTNHFPQYFKTVELFKGDGKNVGTVRLWKYALPGHPADQEFVVKETIAKVDDENRSITYNVLEGSCVLNTYKGFCCDANSLAN
ncbi:hypothetical protein MKW94_027891 [Papaver nudicaule]|uniref:Bet v I/Major latex protein domain-containing protein n=1 Tax=Papaver nudicaule TaxID=74823 RepID=A0AA41RSK0_PAPNU|nr:hypothetical protein [Papaver nudicaule]